MQLTAPLNPTHDEIFVRSSDRWAEHPEVPEGATLRIEQELVRVRSRQRLNAGVLCLQVDRDEAATTMIHPAGTEVVLIDVEPTDVTLPTGPPNTVSAEQLAAAMTRDELARTRGNELSRRNDLPRTGREIGQLQPTADTAPPTTDEPMLRWFEFAHLPEHLQARSAPFFDLACTLVATLPRNPERTVALRKLLEAKDCAVRAAL